MFYRPESLYNLVNRSNSVHDFFLICLLLFYICFSGNYVPIIRTNYRTYATPGIGHFTLYMDECLVRKLEFRPAYQTIIHIE